MPEKLLPFCECGCGQRVSKVGNRFILGHNGRGVPHTSPAQIAADKAESERRRGVTRSPECIAAISKSLLGVPKSPEHCDALSTAKQGIPHTTPAQIVADKLQSEAQRGIPLSPEHIAAIKKGQEDSGMYEIMRGGDDIVNHHYIYDHSDLSLNTVKMTRSDHSKLHILLRKIGYVVPHINTEEI